MLTIQMTYLIVATLKKIDSRSASNLFGIDNTFLNTLINEIDQKGKLKKRLSANKFYFLYYQMTELIPLFSYLERLNVLRYTFKSSTLSTQSNAVEDFKSVISQNQNEFEDLRRPSNNSKRPLRFSILKSQKSSLSEEEKQNCQIDKEGGSNDINNIKMKIEIVDDSLKLWKKDQLKKYEMNTPTPTPGGPQKNDDDIWECAICLDNMSDVLLPCTHAFCNDCINLWQAKQSNCPICRSELLIQCSSNMQLQKADDEFYCIINSNDNLQELAEEISMRVSAATQFIIDRKSITKLHSHFHSVYEPKDLQKIDHKKILSEQFKQKD
eukprot:403355531